MVTRVDFSVLFNTEIPIKLLPSFSFENAVTNIARICYDLGFSLGRGGV